MFSDTYSVGRLSLSRGPNSILCGVGRGVGIINPMSKRANCKRSTELNVRTDRNGSRRERLDRDRPLRPDLARRINAAP